MGGATYTVRQLEFRLRTVNAGTADANAAYDAGDPALNADATIDTGVPFRFRATIEETAGGMANGTTYKLRYSHNGGTYTDVPTSGGPVNVQDNSTYADDAATTQLISTGSFATGRCDDSNNLTDTGVNITSSKTELDFCLQIDAAQVADTDTIALRFYISDGTALNGGYVDTPLITVNEASAPDALLADDIVTGTPTLTSAAIGQTHVLLADDISTGTPTLTSAAVGQTHVLAADDLSAGTPTLTSPVLSVPDVLTADDIATGTPTLTSTALGQTHVLLADDLNAGTPTLTTAALGQDHALLADDVAVGAPTLTSPALAEGADALLADDIAVGLPTLTSPVLTVAGGEEKQPVYKAPKTPPIFRAKRVFPSKPPPYYWQVARHKKLQELRVPTDPKAQKVMVETAAELESLWADLERRDKNFDKMLAQVDRLIERTHALVENYHFSKLLAETKSRIEAAKDAEMESPLALARAEQAEVEDLMRHL